MLSAIRRYFTPLVLLVGCFLLTAQTSAQPRADEAQHKAAALFDQGVVEFSRSHYLEAARAFLAADDAAPSKDALNNALTAALRGELPALAARAAERLLVRPNVDKKTRQAARETLAQLTPKLARLEVSCAFEPCSVALDGEAISAGTLYVVPGGHELTGQNGAGQRASAHVECAAQGQCAVRLEAAPAPAPLVSEPAPQPAPVAPPPPSRVEPPPAGPLVAEKPAAHPERLPLALFASASAGTVLFAALMTWSGVETLHARNLHESDPPRYDRDEVKHLAKRTDNLLIGTALFAGAAIGTGVWWARVRIRNRASVALLPVGGLALRAEVRF